VTFGEVKDITETFRFFKTLNKNETKFPASMQADTFDEWLPWLSKPFIIAAKVSAAETTCHTEFLSPFQEN
jgi:hypothetical protein